MSIMNKGEPTTISGMLVIGAGLPRTGTTSLAAALQTLLKGSCFHGSRIVQFQDRDIDFWNKAMDEKASLTDFQTYFSDQVACLDLPSILFYRELMQAFPEAKVIVTQRDPQSWRQSWISGIHPQLQAIESFPLKWLLRFLDNPKLKNLHIRWRSVIPRGCSMSLNDAIQTPESAEQFYREWMDEVKRNVPEDRLLMFSVNDGWAKLCSFLDHPEPEHPFPELNTSKETVVRIRKMKLMAWSVIVAAPAVLLASGFLISIRVWRRITG